MLGPVHPKGDRSWMYIGRTDAEAETPILWPPDAQSWLIWKDPDVGKDWLQEEKGMTGWDGWRASPTQWTWVWMDSKSWWWTGRPGMLRFMGLQRVGQDWATELNWVFTAVCRLPAVDVSGATFWLGCMVLSLWWPLLLGSMGSRAQRIQQLWLMGSRAGTQQPWCMGSVAPQQVEFSPGTEPMSPIQAGGFLTTGPLGRPYHGVFMYSLGLEFCALLYLLGYFHPQGINWLK